MAMDNPIDAVNGQFSKEGLQDKIVPVMEGIASLAGLFDPICGAAGILLGFVDKLNPSSRAQRAYYTGLALIEVVKSHENDLKTLRARIEDVQSAMLLVVTSDVTLQNDAKKSRYLSVISSVLKSDTRVDDVVSFIQDIERLNEGDIIGLEVVNKVMNKVRDWPVPVHPPNPLQEIKIDPNTFLHRSKELAIEMANAFGKEERAKQIFKFSREEGLQVCLRLQGFGLVQMVGGDNRAIPISDYCARPTSRGLMLLRLLGKEVANWEYYFDENGPL